MIRVFTIFCKLNFIKFSAEDLFLSAVKDFSKDKLPFLDKSCPLCGAKHPKWSYHDSYDRYLISFEAGSSIIHNIKIPLIKCSSCDHTHAVLPEIIIPYGSYSLLFVLNVLRDYYLCSSTVRAICDKYQIATSTLYAWKKLFLVHKKLWLGFLEDAYQNSIEFLSSLPSISSSADLDIFFRNHGLSFLQGASKTALFGFS